MPRSGHYRLLIACLPVALVAAGIRAQTPATVPSYRARLLGVFNVDTGEPIEDAEVIDVLSHTTARTTKTGTVTLSFLPDGGSLVKIQRLGFEPTTIMVAISPVDTVPFTILLRPVARTLPTVVTKDSAPRYISPGLRAFEERRRLGFGKFATEADLRKNDNRPLTNVVRSMGVKVDCTPRVPIRCFANASRVVGQGFCDFDVYIDGVRVTRDERDLEKLHVNQLGGLEAYTGPSTIPPQYNQTGSACGVLLLWTRER